MLPTKFWAEMGWRDFAAADMSKVVAVLPVAAIEQHGPHLPVGVDTFINEGYLAARRRAAARRYAGVVPAGAGDRQVERAYRISRHADLLARDGDPRLDRDRRQRRAHRLPQTDLHEFARRQRAGHRRVARELRVRHRMLAVHAAWHRLGFPDGMFSARRARARHPRRRRRDLADARLQARRPCSMGEAQRFRQRRGRRSSSEFKQLRVTQPIGFGWMSSDLQRARRGRRRRQRDRGEGRSLRRAAAPTRSSICCATSLAFDLARLRPGPLAQADATRRARFRLRARA